MADKEKVEGRWSRDVIESGMDDHRALQSARELDEFERVTGTRVDAVPLLQTVSLPKAEAAQGDPSQEEPR